MKPLTIDECKVGMKVKWIGGGFTPVFGDSAWVIDAIRNDRPDPVLNLRRESDGYIEAGWYPYRFTKVEELTPQKVKAMLDSKEEIFNFPADAMHSVINGVARHFKDGADVTVEQAKDYVIKLLADGGGVFVDQTHGQYTMFILPNGVVGATKCNPKDKYSKEIGSRLAVRRAVHNFFKSAGLPLIPESEVKNKAIDRQIADLQKKIARLESEKV